jgi:hypothetical protein
MARTWGPIEHPEEHNVKPIAADAEGSVTEPHPNSREAAPKPHENYDATDGRHTKSDHQGWPSIDPKSGETDPHDFGKGTGRFPDGPGKWRQT